MHHKGVYVNVIITYSTWDRWTYLLVECCIRYKFTCHLIYVTWYMSHHICHIIYVTWYMSHHIICHIMYVTCHIWAITGVIYLLKYSVTYLQRCYMAYVPTYQRYIRGKYTQGAQQLYERVCAYVCGSAYVSLMCMYHMYHLSAYMHDVYVCMHI
jgi:hypothetical protein